MTDTSSSTGFVTFIADCPRPEFPSVRVPWNAEFPFVVLETTKPCVLAIQVICAPSQNANDTLIEARAIAERIVHELAYRLGCSVGGLAQRDTNILVVDPQGSITGVVSSGVSLHLGGSAESRWVLSEVSTEALVAAARDAQDLQRDSDLELLRSALMTNDPVARFILLYTALGHFTGNARQPGLDNWIRTNDMTQVKASIGESSSKRLRGIITETEFTRVRNTLGHVRSGQTSFTQSVNDARRLLSQLQALTALAISLRYPPTP